MDSVTTPRKSRLARTFAKVLHNNNVEKTKSHEKMKKKSPPPKKNEKDAAIIQEAFLAKLFAAVSSIKAAYAQLQFAQLPYDADGIHSADHIVVSELKNLSELKQCHFKKQFDDIIISPDKALLMSEIQEQKSLLTTYEITTKKLDYQLKLKDSEITFLKEKLVEADKDNRSLEKRISNSSSEPENVQLLSGLLRHSHFITYFRHATKSIRRFVGLLIEEMQFAGWDLEAAVRSIEPGVSFWKPNHICFAFESFVCRVMFDGFNNPNFSDETDRNKKSRHQFRDGFMELKSVGAAEYLASEPESSFAEFCRDKYLRLVHLKMEASLFGNLDMRNSFVGSAAAREFPDMPFFAAFSEVAKRVWLLHCLAFSLDTEASVFRVDKGSRFSEVYMESLSHETFFSSEVDHPRVAFTVVPGFRVRGTLVQCQVYLC